MAFNNFRQAQASGNNPTPSITHGLTIGIDDYIVCVVHVNSGSTSIVPTQSWDAEMELNPSGETCRFGIFVKKATAADTTQSTYDFTSASTTWRVLFQVVSGISMAIDTAINYSRFTSSRDHLYCDATAGETASDNCLSIIVGGNDSRSGVGAFTKVDQSYTNVFGDTNQQMTAMASRVFIGAPTLPTPILINTAGDDHGGNEPTHSFHLSLVEFAGDLTPPFLKTPTATPVDASSASGTVITDDNSTGTLHWYVSTSAGAPSATDLKAGTGAASFGNQAIV